MIYLIDRLLVFSYVKSYVICLFSLLGLYVVVDLFTNIDDFAQVDGLGRFFQHVGVYYAVRTTFIFDRLSEAIVLLAAMFTVAWVQRSNELLPLLSAGVSTRRVLQPVLLSACSLVFLNVANQELLIPQVSGVLTNRGDPENERELLVNGSYDANDVHLTGSKAVRKDLRVYDMHCVIPPDIGSGTLVVLYAAEATYVPDEGRPRTGGWLLQDAEPAELPGWTRTDVLDPIDPGRYFLPTRELDFDALTRDNRKWFYEESTWRIYEALSGHGANRLASMAVLFHTRLTRPLLGMILVVMGLSVILRDQNRNVFISAGLCVILCAVFFTVGVVAKYLGDNEFLSPALAAWLPVFLFGPLAFALFDAVHT